MYDIEFEKYSSYIREIKENVSTSAINGCDFH